MTKDKLLVLFYQKTNQLLSGEQLAREMGVSRNAVWKAVASLREEGFQIDSVSNKGYIFLGHEDAVLSAMELKRQLLYPQDIYVLESVSSTNWYMHKHSDRMKNGSVVIANEQTAGKGKRNGTFLSPNVTGIYMSLFLTPTLSIDALPLLTWRIMDLVRSVLAEEIQKDITIKWPNHLMIDHKIVCGVLSNCFIEAESSLLQYAVVGIGIHVMDDFAPQSVFTSLAMASDCVINRHALVAKILNRIMQQQDSLSSRILETNVLQDINQHLYDKEEQVSIQLLSGDKISGKMLDVNSEGGIRLLQEDGKFVMIQKGELL